MSLRAALVDAFKAESTINNIVSGKVFDMFYEFEDLLTQKANASKFPAITIQQDSWEREQNQDGHDNIINTSFSITLYQQLHLGKLRSRVASIRTTQKNLLRDIDTLNDAVVSYINNLGGVLSSYYIRNSHIDLVADGVFETEGNREIITKEISYTVTYS